MKTTVFICTLKSHTQSVIKKDITSYLASEGIVGIEAYAIIENAMDGRLCDLEDNLGDRIPYYLSLETI